MTALPSNIELLFAFCPTGEGGGVDNSCSSRDGKGDATKQALLEAAKNVPIKRLEKGGLSRFDERNAWGVEGEIATYRFRTPSNREFLMTQVGDHLSFVDDKSETSATGKGEAHFIFSEVTKAVTALASRTNTPRIRFTADAKSASRQKLYTRLAKSLAELVPNATASIFQYEGLAASYVIKLRDSKDLAFSHDVEMLFAFCPTGEGGGVDPTCSPANAGKGDSGGDVAKAALLKDARHIAILSLKETKGLAPGDEFNSWVTKQATYDPSVKYYQYKFKTPSGRAFTVMFSPDGEISFDDNLMSMHVTGKGEAHHVFGEVAKATVAMVRQLRPSYVKFSSDGDSRGRDKLYARLAKSLAALIPGGKATTKPLTHFSSGRGLEFKVVFFNTGA